MAGGGDSLGNDLVDGDFGRHGIFGEIDGA